MIDPSVTISDDGALEDAVSGVIGGSYWPPGQGLASPGGTNLVRSSTSNAVTYEIRESPDNLVAIDAGELSQLGAGIPRMASEGFEDRSFLAEPAVRS
jgi:hypothetical protein